jgi:hypothetical protein
LAVDYRAFVQRTGVPAILRYASAIKSELPGIEDDSDPGAVLAALERSSSDGRRVWLVFQEAEAFSPRDARWVMRSVLVSHPDLPAARAM